jgi:competence protein ComEA
MKTWWTGAGLLVFGLLIGLLATGVILLVSDQPRGEPVQLLPPPTVPPIIVHVKGAVVNPGVYSLPPTSRVIDALSAAGGLSPNGDTTSLNLAGFLQDGQSLPIPHKAPTSTFYLYLLPTEAVPNEPGENPSGLIDLNTASFEELDSLPGIGEDKAQKILSYRQENGPFLTIEAIQEVSGIGPATFENIKALICVNPLP